MSDYTARPYILAEATWKETRSNDYSVAVLPWGATEAHNFHLPYGTDTIQVENICAGASKRAFENGVHVMCLPVIPFGVNSAQKNLPFHIDIKPSTQFILLKDIVESLEAQKIKRLLVVNGHGGNSFSHMIRELYTQSSTIVACTTWFTLASAKDFFIEPGDHADEMETSVMMHLCPHLVKPISEAGEGIKKNLLPETFQNGLAWTQRGWLGVTTDDTGVGNPKLASGKKGEAFLAEAVTKLTQVIVDFSRIQLKDVGKNNTKDL
jgi:creatinine amidohydrolase